MPLLPIELPAGIYRNGTDLQSSNRWRDANLVRWIDNTIQPIKGWIAKSATVIDAPARGAINWVDNSSGKNSAVGTANKLFYYSVDGTQFDITPAGLAAGRVDAESNTGYGVGLYGVGDYSSTRAESALLDPATTWSLDNFGEFLIACSDADGLIYEWQLDTGVPAAVIPNAPIDNRGIIVTAERFVMALGAGGNPRLIQWSDRENNNLWTPLATNEAGDIELQTSGVAQCAVQVRGQTLIITTMDAHTATYNGPPFVYDIERVGTDCGVIGKRAATSTDVGAFWMGDRAFFAFQGNGIQELDSSVSDFIFNNINRDQVSKVYAMSNGKYGEIWWFYPSSNSIENDSYVIFNFKENSWYFGSIDRTAGADAGAFRNPTMYSGTTLLPYEHEFAFAYDGETPFAESGPISLGAGDNVMIITDMYPDEQTQGEVTALFKTRFYPNDIEREYGPYTMSAPTSVRFTGRQIRMRITGAVNEDWRVGITRLETKAGGRR